MISKVSTTGDRKVSQLLTSKYLVRSFKIFEFSEKVFVEFSGTYFSIVEGEAAASLFVRNQDCQYTGTKRKGGISHECKYTSHLCDDKVRGGMGYQATYPLFPLPA